jgi:hypothetical protein
MSFEILMSYIMTTQNLHYLVFKEQNSWENDLSKPSKISQVANCETFSQ